MELTPYIVDAILKACIHAGSQTALASEAGIKPQNISRYLNGTVTKVTPKNMANLWPHIRDYLPEDFTLPGNFGAETNAEILLNHQKNNENNNYTIYKLMLKALYDLGADQLLFHIMIYWHGMNEEQKKKAYTEVRKIAENKENDSVIDQTQKD